MREIYKDLNALKGIQEPFKSALVILQDLYVNGPENNKPISNNLPLHMAINAAQVIYETVKQDLITYVPVLRNEIQRIYISSNYRNNTFEEFKVTLYSELACIMGCAYYAMVLDEEFNDNQLKNIEKISVSYRPGDMIPYFNVFKKAAEERKMAANTPAKATTSTNDDVKKLRNECEQKDKEIQRLESIIKEYTDEKVANGKPYFTTNQIAIALYFLLDNNDTKVIGNKDGWAKFIAKLVRRSHQNLREAFLAINKDLSALKNDAEVVANALDHVAPVIADKIRQNCDIVVTTEDK